MTFICKVLDLIVRFQDRDDLQKYLRPISTIMSNILEKIKVFFIKRLINIKSKHFDFYYENSKFVTLTTRSHSKMGMAQSQTEDLYLTSFQTKMKFIAGSVSFCFIT